MGRRRRKERTEDAPPNLAGSLVAESQWAPNRAVGVGPSHFGGVGWVLGLSSFWSAGQCWNSGRKRWREEVAVSA